MFFSDIEKIKEAGFTGFVDIENLIDKKHEPSKHPGVYMVIKPDNETIEFINPGSGGFFKGKNPNVDISVLKQNYVNEAIVLYIGKAGSLTGKATLYSRINQYLKFGQGKNIGHWGGRYIWQIKNPEKLIFCWKPIDTEPKEYERALINSFIKQYGKMPFANLV